ncbi:hypothetical protein IF1G_11035 [Cordyceps javanica]|uniref:Uncharacterized protein n=1 Tax=Cordyceps javanica TaxID=43265 RepID=A0A545ULD8_9HYPO|nr:hypothetical protein IF1G_11035 [Cordyceps javanica]TQW01735.1 hypothetical protein IF2G_10717 [Cordyceps javanica]
MAESDPKTSGKVEDNVRKPSAERTTAKEFEENVENFRTERLGQPAAYQEIFVVTKILKATQNNESHLALAWFLSCPKRREIIGSFELIPKNGRKPNSALLKAAQKLRSAIKDMRTEALPTDYRIPTESTHCEKCKKAVIDAWSDSEKCYACTGSRSQAEMEKGKRPASPTPETKPEQAVKKPRQRDGDKKVRPAETPTLAPEAAKATGTSDGNAEITIASANGKDGKDGKDGTLPPKPSAPARAPSQTPDEKST